MSKTSDQKIIGNFKIGKIIGTGTFGKVRQGLHLPTGQKVAIKMLQKKKIKNDKDIQRIQKQLQILKNINHPNILKLLEVKETDKYIFIVTQLAKGQQLYDRIVRKGSLSTDQACKYFCQLFQAVKFLHSVKVAHRDIKPQNIIVDGDALKLIDFGLSTQWTQSKIMMETPCGSPCYAAPQMVIGKKYDCRKVDIWAMGITLYAMIVGRLPFQHENTLKLYKLIENSDFDDIKGIPSYVNLLLKAMIQKDPKKRITIHQIEQNIWIRDSLKAYQINQNTKKQWNKFIIKEMQCTLKQPSKVIISKLNQNPISELATFYYLKVNKYKKGLSICQDEIHDGPFHIQFVFKNTQMLEAYLEKNFIKYQWVNSKNSFNYSPELNDQKVEKNQLQKKKYISIDGQILTIKKLKNMSKLIYLQLKNINTQNNKQNSKIPMFSNSFQRSHTHLDSSRSQMDNLCIETY